MLFFLRRDMVGEAVEFLMEKIRAAQRDHGTCIIGLSGGRTPRVVYEELGVRFQVLGYRGKNIHMFLVDERYVPPNHPESNQQLVRETLLKNFPTLEEHIIFPNTTLPIDDCVADYTHRLKELWKEHLPDLVILGMGTDGHTASLFPPLSEQAVSDQRLVLHTRAPEGIGPASARDRITLSLHAIAAANEQVLLLQGAEKKRVWEETLVSSEDERRWPLKQIMETGKLTVFTQPPALPS